MLMQSSRTVPKNLARVELDLMPRAPRSAWLVWPAALAIAAAAGAAALQVHTSLQAEPVAHSTALPDPQGMAQGMPQGLPQGLPQDLAQNLERAHLQLRVAEARSLELERQVDLLNQRLHASQEEVTFFRKAVNGKR